MRGNRTGITPGWTSPLPADPSIRHSGHSLEDSHMEGK